MKKKWNIFAISETRSILMGLATVLVAFFHCYKYRFSNIFSNTFLINLGDFLRKSSNIGVNLFLILSGIGLYFSFSKNSNIKDFYKKRAFRILPSIIIVAFIYYLFIKKVAFLELIKGVTLTSFFIDGTRDFWYFSLIIVLYLIYPLLHKLIDKYDFKGLLFLLFLSISSTVIFMLVNDDLYTKYEIALTRIPDFLIGIYIGKQILNKKEIPKAFIFIFLILFILTNFVLFSFKFKYYIFVRYLGCVLGISIIFIISYIHSIIKINVLDKVIIFIGKYSMEIYLIFEKLCVEINKAHIINIKNNFIFYSLMFGLAFILSIILNIICKNINKLVNKEQPKKVSLI